MAAVAAILAENGKIPTPPKFLLWLLWKFAEMFFRLFPTKFRKRNFEFFKMAAVAAILILRKIMFCY